MTSGVILGFFKDTCLQLISMASGLATYVHAFHGIIPDWAASVKHIPPSYGHIVYTRFFHMPSWEKTSTHESKAAYEIKSMDKLPDQRKCFTSQPIQDLSQTARSVHFFNIKSNGHKYMMEHLMQPSHQFGPQNSIADSVHGIFCTWSFRISC